MKQMPKAVRDLQGDLWVPAELADLLERVLRDARAIESQEHRRCLAELERLMGFNEQRALPSGRELLGMPDPQQEQLAENLLKE
jgi:hypothetical protein